MSHYRRSSVTIIGAKVRGFKGLVRSGEDIDIKAEDNDLSQMDTVIEVPNGSSTIEYKNNKLDSFNTVVKVNEATQPNTDFTRLENNVVNGKESEPSFTVKKQKQVEDEAKFKERLKELLNLEALARYSQDYVMVRRYQVLRENLWSSHPELRKLDLDKE